MNNIKYAAHTQNKTFFFYITKQDENEISITMYNALYTFVKNNDSWINYPSNYFTMAPHLIQAVVDSVKNGIRGEQRL